MFTQKGIMFIQEGGVHKRGVIMFTQEGDLSYWVYAFHEVSVLLQHQLHLSITKCAHLKGEREGGRGGGRKEGRKGRVDKERVVD